MRVVLYRETEVPRRAAARQLDHVFPAAKELDHQEREVRKMVGIRLHCREEELLERLAVRLAGERGAALGGELDNPGPLGGCAHDAPAHRELLRLKEPRGHAV